jgi:hypothetical protein
VYARLGYWVKILDRWPAQKELAQPGKTDLAEIVGILTEDSETALRELAGYDPAMFEAANEEYLASIGAAKPEAQTDGNGSQDGASFRLSFEVDKEE